MKTGSVETFDLSNDVKLEMVYIEGGSFMMGSPEDEVGRDDNETQHHVRVEGFYIGKYTVTQSQWEAVMGSNPSYWKSDNLPVEQISWDDCQEFIEKLNSRAAVSAAKMTGGTPVLQFRLPTEAEWEYACRAGTQTPFHYGNVLSSEMANFNRKLPYHPPKGENIQQMTMPVGSFKPNEWGLYDMHGNIGEWVENLYPDSNCGSLINSVWVYGNFRIVRGGSWLGGDLLCRSAIRGGVGPAARRYIIGVRLAADKPGF